MEKDFSGRIRKAIWDSRENLPIPIWPIIYPNTTTCPRCHTEVFPQANRPDIVCLSRGVEVKEADERFDFSSISDGQREWASARVAEGFSYWLALQVGIDRVDSKSEKRKHAYLIPWLAWLAIENNIIAIGSKSIPLIAGNHHRILNENGYDCVRLLAQYELNWNKGWNIPENHVWYQTIAKTLMRYDSVLIQKDNDTWRVSMDDIVVSGSSINEVVELLERGIVP